MPHLLTNVHLLRVSYRFTTLHAQWTNYCILDQLHGPGVLEVSISSIRESSQVPLDVGQCMVLDKSLYKRYRVSVFLAAPGAVSTILSPFGSRVVPKHLRSSRQFNAAQSRALLTAAIALEEHLTKPCRPPRIASSQPAEYTPS